MEHRKHAQNKMGPADDDVQEWINDVSRDLWSHATFPYSASPTSYVNTTAAHPGGVYMPGTSREYFTNADHPWIPEYHHDQYAEDIETSLETQPLSEDEINTDLADQNELPPEMSLCQSFSRAAITEELSSLGMGALGGTSSHEGAKATRGKKKNTDLAKGRHRRKSQLLQADAVDSKTSVALQTETGSHLENPAGAAGYPEPELFPSLEVLHALPFTTGMNPLRPVHAPGSRNIRGPFFWEFILRLLADTNSNPSLIFMEDASQMIVRLKDHYKITKLWGLRQGNDNLSYPHFSRSLRYWYGKYFTPFIEKKLMFKLTASSIEYLQELYNESIQT